MEQTTEAITPINKLDAQSLIAQAIDNKVPVETMEKLLSMRRELKAEYAKEEFDRSLAAFQANCPVIKKTKEVNFTSKRTGGRTQYKYAPLESIVLQVKKLLQQHGFSYTVNTKQNGQITAICKVTHEQGHSEKSELTVPIDSGAFMNEQQKVASALTFAKRYAFCNAFGILTGDEDDDSRSNEPFETTNPERNKEVEYEQVDPEIDEKVYHESTDATVTPKQVKAIYAITKELGAKDKEDATQIIRKVLAIKIESVTNLSINKASGIIGGLKAELDKQKEKPITFEDIKEVDINKEELQ